MNAAALLFAVLLASAADDLVPFKVQPLRLMIPAAWNHTVEPGASHRFSSPSEDGSFQLDVFPLESPLSASECRDKLVKALGGSGWELVTLGKAPAARKRYSDTGEIPEGEKAPVEVETHSYVGCNGKTKWAMTFTFDVRKRTRYRALVDKITRSIEYVKITG